MNRKDEVFPAAQSIVLKSPSVSKTHADTEMTHFRSLYIKLLNVRRSFNGNQCSEILYGQNKLSKLEMALVLPRKSWFCIIKSHLLVLQILQR